MLSSEGSAGRVLIVDDDPTALELLRREISGIPAEVRACADAVSAFTEIELWEPDVLLLDVCLPGMDGIELARSLRERLPATEIVLVTGFADLESAVAAVRLGAFEYLMKPLDDPGQIERTVKGAIRSAREKRRPRLDPARLLELLPLPALLVNRECQLIATNSNADIILRDPQARLISQRTDGAEQLRCLEPQANEQLQALVRHACQLEQPAVAGALRLPCAYAAQREKPLVVVSLGRSHDGAFLAAIVIGHRSSTEEQGVDVLAAAYGLTAAEARVAGLLTEGYAVEQAAALLDVSVATVRSHLLKLFSKTSTNRQVDLVAELIGGPVLRHLPVSIATPARPRRSRPPPSGVLQ